VLASIVRPSERKSITGDLLEEYREVQRPQLGARRADGWYVRQVFSLLWHIMWPSVALVVVMKAATLALQAFVWNRSLVQLPGVSIVDAVIGLLVGFYGAQRTGLLRTGACMAGLLNVFAVIVLLMVAAVRSPALLMAPFEKPFMFVILSVVIGAPLGFGLAFGSLGALVGRWTTPARRRAA